MSFDRARSKENKEIRFTEIKNAACKLFDTMAYSDITLSKISAEINFTRANLYKYVKSKEEIFILIMKDEYNSLVKDLKENLMLDHPLDSKSFCNLYANVCGKHTRFLKLQTILSSIIEENTNIETLIEYKNGFVDIIKDFYDIYNFNFNGLDSDDIFKIMDYSNSLMISRHIVCHSSEKQQLALQASKFNFQVPDFEETLSEAMQYLIKGIKVSKL
ncbi:TetR family transcriptional regulator [Vallitalea okinawensis]|uniref:TetR family transcriptional regulator n=1 Tax=Vallitalea okinawensis TaxID=2078660 RepID=UPI000CFC0ED8|nr:TetR family transcriptional regulator [Vallitalea okinawensis]